MIKAKKSSKNSFHENKDAWLLLISCFLIYVAMMVCKSLYNAEIIEVIKEFKISKAVAGYPTTAYYFTYGFAQLLIAKILPKINLRKYLLVTMSLSAICTFLVSVSTELWQILILFALNGLFHAALWPSCVLVIGKYLPVRMQSTANGLMSVGFAVGFIISYLSSALFIGISDWTHSFIGIRGWKITFLIFGALTIIPTILFAANLKKADKNKQNDVEETKSQSNNAGKHLNHKLIKKYLAIFYFLVLVVVFLTNIAYYGVNTWIPNLMNDEFNVNSEFSTLLTVLVPIVSLIGPLLAIKFTNRHNLWFVAIGFCVVPSLVSLILSFAYASNLILSLSMSIIVITSLRGTINTVSTSLSLKTRNLFNAGSFTAIINALASLGASASPPLSGGIIDAYKGNRIAYYIFMFVILFVSTVILFILNRLTKRIRVLRSSVLEK